jgi:hypothetical protein
MGEGVYKVYVVCGMCAYRYQGRGSMEKHKKKAKGRVITDEL